MARYEVHYKRGVRKIVATSLEHAEQIANTKIKSWTDIYGKAKREAK
jgi:hypothetical protein